MKVDVKSRRTRTTDSSAASTMSAGKKFLFIAVGFLLVIAIIASLLRDATTAEPVVEGVLTTEEFITQYGGEFVAEYKQLSQDYLTHLRQEADERNLGDDDIDWDRLEHDLTPNPKEALDLAREIYTVSDYEWGREVIRRYSENPLRTERNFLFRELAENRCVADNCDGMMRALKAFGISSRQFSGDHPSLVWMVCDLLQELIPLQCCSKNIKELWVYLDCDGDPFDGYYY